MLAFYVDDDDVLTPFRRAVSPPPDPEPPAANAYGEMVYGTGVYGGDD